MIYFVHNLVTPSPNEAEAVTAQSGLHSEVVDQYMDGDTLVVSMRNVGSNPWKETGWIRCTIFLDGKDSDVRAHLEPGQVVPVGESVEFRFPDIKPMLNETAEIVMLQENVAYFPEKVPVIFAQATTPATGALLNPNKTCIVRSLRNKWTMIPLWSPCATSAAIHGKKQTGSDVPSSLMEGTRM